MPQNRVFANRGFGESIAHPLLLFATMLGLPKTFSLREKRTYDWTSAWVQKGSLPELSDPPISNAGRLIAALCLFARNRHNMLPRPGVGPPRGLQAGPAPAQKAPTVVAPNQKNHFLENLSREKASEDLPQAVRLGLCRILDSWTSGHLETLARPDSLEMLAQALSFRH